MSRCRQRFVFSRCRVYPTHAVISIDHNFDLTLTAILKRSRCKGSGYLVSCIGAYMKLFGKGSPKVFGIEHVPELVHNSLHNIQNDRPDLLESGIASIIGVCRRDIDSTNRRFPDRQPILLQREMDTKACHHMRHLTAFMLALPLHVCVLS
jgi:hypothetical protein